MTGIYVFYITADERVVANSPSVYDRVLIHNRAVWLRTERANANDSDALTRAFSNNSPRPGEQFLGAVEV